MLPKGYASIKIGKTSEHGMEQEDFGNIGVGKTLECRKMLEDCGKHQKHQSVEQENIGVWNRKMLGTLEMLECELGMEIWGGV